MSSCLNSSTVNFTNESIRNKSNSPNLVQERIKPQKISEPEKKPIEIGKKSSADLILRKLGKSFETENSSKNTSGSEIDVMKTSYVDKSRNHKEPPRKWGTDMKKSFATNLSSEYDSDLDDNDDEDRELSN